jgi:hypothetical protein
MFLQNRLFTGPRAIDNLTSLEIAGVTRSELEFRSFHSHRSCEVMPNTTRLATLKKGDTTA